MPICADGDPRVTAASWEPVVTPRRDGAGGIGRRGHFLAPPEPSRSEHHAWSEERG
jgi:hypothetical protein